jgi:methylated-DNA-[protein]-cysteine S-methyltransferase
MMENRIYLGTLQTDLLGLVGVAVSPAGLLRLRMFQSSPGAFLKLNAPYGEGEYIFSGRETKPVLEQIAAYLDRELKIFSLPIDWTGYTDFQRAVLRQTVKIPYGETRSYGEIAAEVGSPRAFRAVGQAEKHNQVPLVVPCHRVIGSDGSMTGYGGKSGTAFKARLIAFEKEG